MIDRNLLLIDGALHRAIALVDEIEGLIAEVPESRVRIRNYVRLKLHMGSGSSRAKLEERLIGDLAGARAVRESAKNGNGKPPKRTMTAAQKASLSKRMKAQWAAAKAAGVKGAALPSYAHIESAKRKQAKKAAAPSAS